MHTIRTLGKAAIAETPHPTTLPSTTTPVKMHTSLLDTIPNLVDTIGKAAYLCYDTRTHTTNLCTTTNICTVTSVAYQ